MPGGSPYFPDDDHIETLYRDLERLFEQACRHFQGMTLGEFTVSWGARAISPG
jgi:hypothetical protein